MAQSCGRWLWQVAKPPRGPKSLPIAASPPERHAPGSARSFPFLSSNYHPIPTNRRRDCENRFRLLALPIFTLSESNQPAYDNILQVGSSPPVLVRAGREVPAVRRPLCGECLPGLLAGPAA